ncbi:MAG: 50S ribosomal protein L11 methyltransferase [Thermoplasmata archaeon]|jgi:ribosomal protein L11 methylase PrmA
MADALVVAEILTGIGIAFVVYFFFGSFLFGAGYEPTGRARVDALLEMAEVGPTDTLYELGAGTGAIALRAAETRGARVVAVEIDPVRVAVLALRRALSPARSRITVRRQDLFRTDLTSATVVSTFLWPSAMTRLGPRLQRELAPGSRIVSYYHPLTGWTPEAIDRARRIYLYRVPSRPRDGSQLKADGT